MEEMSKQLRVAQTIGERATYAILLVEQSAKSTIH